MQIWIQNNDGLIWYRLLKESKISWLEGFLRPCGFFRPGRLDSLTIRESPTKASTTPKAGSYCWWHLLIERRHSKSETSTRWYVAIWNSYHCSLNILRMAWQNCTKLNLAVSIIATLPSMRTIFLNSSSMPLELRIPDLRKTQCARNWS